MSLLVRKASKFSLKKYLCTCKLTVLWAIWDVKNIYIKHTDMLYVDNKVRRVCKSKICFSKPFFEWNYLSIQNVMHNIFNTREVFDTRHLCFALYQSSCHAHCCVTSRTSPWGNMTLSAMWRDPFSYEVYFSSIFLGEKSKSGGLTYFETVLWALCVEEFVCI